MPLRNLCWVLTPGEAGMRSQALGLAEAVGLPVEEKRISVRAPYAWLPGGLLPMPLAALDPSSDPLTPPWPRLVVGCGRRSIGPALMVKRLSGGRTLAAYVQNPEWGRRRFDLVAAMPHDGVTGSNVIMVPSALHGVTQQRLAEARETWRARLASNGRPVLGVLVGGDNGGYRLTARVAAQLIRILKAAHEKHGMRAAITPSRRTPDDIKRLLRNALASKNLGSMWDQVGENPYLGILALSDRLIVTAESISMISEALATGRPVHVLPLEGQGKRHDAFLMRSIAERLVSPIQGDDLDWSFASPGPIDSTAEPAARIKAMLDRRSVA
jgi:mitochondrial fission protein ELM1